jgi:hypothetical protein
MVVGRVAGHTVRDGELPEAGKRLVLVGKQRLLHQDVLAVRQEVLEKRCLLAIGHADESRVVRVARHVLDRPVVRPGDDGIDRRHGIRPGDLQPLPALDPQADDHHPQSK